MTDNGKKMEAPIVPVMKETKGTTEAMVLKEGFLSWAGKIFFAGVAAYLAGKALQNDASPPKMPFKLRGTPEQINAVVSMVMASKKFQEELAKGQSVEQVINKLNLKNLTKEKFHSLTGRSWPL